LANKIAFKNTHADADAHTHTHTHPPEKPIPVSLDDRNGKTGE